VSAVEKPCQWSRDASHSGDRRLAYAKGFTRDARAAVDDHELETTQPDGWRKPSRHFTR